MPEAKRLRSLEDENSKLKKLLAEAMLDIAVLKDITGNKVVTPGAKRDAAMHAQTAFGLSERRACDLVGVSRRVASYRSTRPDDTPLRVWLRELAAERRRFGYRRLGYLLAAKA